MVGTKSNSATFRKDPVFTSDPVTHHMASPPIANTACVARFFLQVTFVNESGIDNGGPSREFWRLFKKAAAQRYCMGSPGNCVFFKDTPALLVGCATLE